MALTSNPDAQSDQASRTLTSRTSLELRIALYNQHRDTTLREMVAIDHFSDTVPPSLVDKWLLALNPDPSHAFFLPPEVKGFYGSDLRASILIELAHDCYKYIMHETQDRAKIAKYTGRMLLAIRLLDLGALEAEDVNLAGLALWHRALALVRIAEGSDDGGQEELAETLRRYEGVRARSMLSDAKLPQPGRLKARLLASAKELDNKTVVACLEAWTLL
ncbi:uncharacterized protein B0I36DRAFT_244909 [Microdochium trichocladiopsis]|uniref:Uncharacterized protein n=1 Tax=Microdochium trichocladiopsis TaxID=1682393 RepID=A0A9P9BMT0_9PEZI|nr:uncharacterized protein B0I36DRAFT_244909 [Microdochium trichocladiopsis]KAH7029933.1 hypothetical protein B0I36DRAFT_244909 [Microdochium trichocladiopsis]